LPLYASKGDAFIAHLQKVLATTSGLDSVLCVMYYGSTLLSSQLHLLSDVVSRLPTSDAVEKQATIALRRQQIKAWGSLCSDVRAFMRLSGLLSMYRWGVSTYQNPPKDIVLRNIAWSQVICNSVYQVIENAAYLAQHGVITMDGARQKYFWLLTGRLWMMHTLLDFLRLARTAQISGRDGAKDAVTKAEASERWWRELTINSAYAPLTVHWSTETGLISEAAVGILGCIAGSTGFMAKWRAAA
jgi:hypothetical protein